ncbi:hypothetical protein ACFE04_000373 [Oxalis oulophora]
MGVSGDEPPPPPQQPPPIPTISTSTRGQDLEKGEEISHREQPQPQPPPPLMKMNNNNNTINNEDGERISRVAMLQRLNPTNPLRIAINNSRVNTPSPSHGHNPPHVLHSSQPRSTPTPLQQSSTSLNSTQYTDKFFLFLFVLHMVAAIALVGFLVFKAIQGLIQAKGRKEHEEKTLLRYFLPQVEVSSLLSIILAFSWQWTIRIWPYFMVHFILWSTFFISLSAGIFLICLQNPPTDGIGVCFIAFSICSGLYACWVSQRIKFCSKILVKSLESVPKFQDLNKPAFWTLLVGFIWISLWIFAVLGALNFYFPPLVIILLVLSLCWTAEVMRNVVNITVSRVIALYYLRGMQSNTHFCFQRALTKNLGSACLGSLFVPTIEALRVVARALNLLEGEDEFMFSCAHCCLNVMDTIFRYGNGWAYVQIAAYGKGFVRASQDTWELFVREDMEEIVDSDMTSALCFLTGVCSGSTCVIVAAAWTAKMHQPYTATVSLIVFFVGYLMTRISMALPHACVSCYYTCYAENPTNRLFDKTIKERQAMIKSGREVLVPTPRIPHR